MDCLQKKFEVLFRAYQRNRKRSEKKVMAWRAAGKDVLADEATLLIDKIDSCFQGIQLGSTQTAEGLEPLELLQDRYKQLEDLMAEFDQFMQPSWQRLSKSLILSFFVIAVLRLFVFGLHYVPTGSAEPNILVGDRILGNKLAYLFADVQRGDLVIFDNPEFIYDHTHAWKYLWQKYVGIELPFLNLEAGPENWVKRVIALPGDTIEGRIERGQPVIYLNGERYDEPYVNEYPLIRLRKTTGFFKRKGVPILRQKTKDVNYTYDPTCEFASQPYYSLSEEEIVRTAMSQNLVLTHPKTPTYVLKHQGKAELRSIDVFGPITVPKGMYWVMGDSRKNSRDSRYWGLLDGKMIRGRASRVLYSIDSEESLWMYTFIKHPFSFLTHYVRWSRFFKRLN